MRGQVIDAYVKTQVEESEDPTTSEAKATWAMPAAGQPEGRLTSSESVRRLRARWEAPQQQELAALVLERLVFGGSFDDLELGRIDGRVDLRGFQAPPPRRLREFRLSGLVFAELAGLVEVAGVTWQSLDLSGASLEHLRVKDARIEDRRLDRAACLGLRIWRSAIADSTLVKADLRHTGLGPWSEGRGNVTRWTSSRRA